MPTRNRREWVPLAIRCFQQQTYPRKELVSVADGERIDDLMPRDPSIRLRHLPSKRTIGAKRNLCCEMARGEIIAHWDDDDWSDPRRLEEQVRALRENPRAVLTGYRAMLFHDCLTGRIWQYSGKADYALGTSLMYYKSWWTKHRFQNFQVGEDNAFVKQARGRCHLIPAENMMVARGHGKTTSPKQWKGKSWVRVDRLQLPVDFPR